MKGRAFPDSRTMKSGALLSTYRSASDESAYGRYHRSHRA